MLNEFILINVEFFYLDTLVFILFFKNGINYWKDEIDKIKLLWDFHSIVPEKLVVPL